MLGLCNLQSKHCGKALWQSPGADGAGDFKSLQAFGYDVLHNIY